MKTKKHTNNLQKSSVLFLQLGLVLTLFTVYVAFELKTEQRTALVIGQSIDDEPYEFVNIKEFRIEEKIVKKTKSISKKKKSPIFVVDDTPLNKKEKLPFEPKKSDDDNPIGLNDLEDEGKGDDILDPDGHLVNIANVQEVPIFPGCEKVKKEKRRACFEKKISKHIQRKFNADLGNQLGLSSGIQKIYVQFVISKTGTIEVLGAKAPHKRLMTEGKRVVNKLPRMIPGKQNGKDVGVKYMLPIVFNVE